MREITQREARKIYALYYGQNILRYNEEDIDVYPVDWHNIRCDLLHLSVKPLSSITDEDSIEVAKMLGYEHLFYLSKIEWTKNHIDYFKRSLSYLPVSAIDYLRSKGYALPAMGYSIDELIAAGVFKLTANHRPNIQDDKQ